MKQLIHPNEALLEGSSCVPILPACEHIAGRERLMRKSIELQAAKNCAFDITLDCEDGASIGEELAHATLVVSLIASPDNRYNRIGARCHGVRTPFWRKEITVFIRDAGERIAYITLPKAESVDDVLMVCQAIQEECLRWGISRKIPLHVLIETHGALRAVETIAALPEVESLDFGLMDFIAAHSGAIPLAALRSPQQFDHALIRHAKTKIASAALANSAVPTHNVCVDLKNPEQTAADARRARDEFGFLRMWSIYPSQIDAIISGMTPDFSEIESEAAVLLRGQEAAWGPIEYCGQLHDCASYRIFWTRIQQARLAGISLPKEAEERWFSDIS